MPRASWATDAVYLAAERFIEECLRKDGSLFTPGRPVWTAANAADLFARVGEWGEGGRFWDKLDDQVESASDEVRQLAAEAMFVQYLGEDKTRGVAKRSTLEHLLVPAGLEIPTELDNALDSGLSDPGAGKAHRPTYLRSLLDFARRWKETTGEERAGLLDDPWAFRDFVDSGGAQAEILIHLVFPETFEPIGSARAKKKVAETFALLPGVSDELDIDRKLQLIREQLSAILGADFGFYNSPVEPVWAEKEPAEWSAFLEWAERLHPRGDWNETERDYKLEIAANLRVARQALDGQNWLSLLRTAFGRPNNLTNRFEHGPFLDWCENDPALARDFLRELWEGDYESVLRGAMFVVPTDVLPGRAARAAVASFLLAGRDAERFPFFRMTVYEKASKLVGHETVSSDATVEDLYSNFVALLDELRVRFLARGHAIDRTDAQGLAWWITSAEPPEDWDDDEKRAFLAYQGGELPSRRAWLVRGANNQGENMLPAWFSDGYVSIGWANATSFPLDSGIDEIRDRLRQDRPEVPEGEVIRGSGIVKRFLDIAPGDLIVTPDSDALYVARATGKAYWADGDDASALRRPVEWLNKDKPASRAAVRETAPGLWRRLRTLLTVSELTDDLTAVEELLDGDTPPPPPPRGEEMISPVSTEFAKDLLLPTEWLNEVVGLLNEKKQVIFYGPPGTGKTWLARALGQHVEAGGGGVSLVQFHPAYSYEDFFEGYRPSHDGEGLDFRLRSGPLRRIAEQAERDPNVPHLLVIDEINRGSIAKIFGELYFLLEYREDPIRLQYSPDDDFRLPENLFFIGTMNTADRSIALLDSALRRRFYFVGFFPQEPPLDGVLRAWIQTKGYDEEPADYQAALNKALADAGSDEEFAIGHSYFMTKDGPPDLGRIWRRAILPLLEERFYGARRRQDIEKDFGIDAIRHRLESDAEEAESSHDS